MRHRNGDFVVENGRATRLGIGGQSPERGLPLASYAIPASADSQFLLKTKWTVTVKMTLRGLPLMTIGS